MLDPSASIGGQLVPISRVAAPTSTSKSSELGGVIPGPLPRSREPSLNDYERLAPSSRKTSTQTMTITSRLIAILSSIPRKSRGKREPTAAPQIARADRHDDSFAVAMCHVRSPRHGAAADERRRFERAPCPRSAMATFDGSQLHSFEAQVLK